MFKYIGEDAFRAAMKTYFKKFPLQNTVLNDLVGELQAACDAQNLDIDLKGWCETWLKTSGVNNFKPEFQVSAGKVSKFIVHQGCEKHG